MDGGGNWIKGGPGIRAGGNFAGLDTVGSWRAIFLTTEVCCSPGTSGSGIVVFSVLFNGVDGQLFFKNVVVAENDADLNGVGTGNPNFWVEEEGFGTANARFN